MFRRGTPIWHYLAVGTIVLTVLSFGTFLAFFNSPTLQDFNSGGGGGGSVDIINASVDRRRPITSTNSFASNEDAVINPHPFRYLIDCPNACGDGGGGDGSSDNVYLLVYVHTSPDHVERRIVIRQTWGDWRRYDFALRIIFLMGLPTAPTSDLGSKMATQTPAQKTMTSVEVLTAEAAAAKSAANVQRAVELEAGYYGDIVQEDFVDTYHNLTYKAVAALRWIATNCRRARFVLKTDDDIFVNMYILRRHLERLDQLHVMEVPVSTTTTTLAAAATASETADSTKKRRRPVSPSGRRLLMCNVWNHMHVRRSGPWRVSASVWNASMYPRYCSGMAFVMSTDLAVDLHRVSYGVPFFWIDDVYVTGLLTRGLDVEWVQLMAVYWRDTSRFEELFTGQLWYRYVFAHVGDMQALRRVWKTVADRARRNVSAVWTRRG